MKHYDLHKIMALLGDCVSVWHTIPSGIRGEIAALVKQANAVDDVLDEVREMLTASSHAAEMAAIDRLRVLMGKVDDDD